MMNAPTFDVKRHGHTINVATFTEGDMLAPHIRRTHPVVDVVLLDDHLVLQSPYNHAVLHVAHTAEEVVTWMRQQQPVPDEVAERVALLCGRGKG